MKSKNQRMVFIIAGLISAAIAVALILSTFSDNLVFYYGPSELQQHNITAGKIVRIGGLVKEGSVQKDSLHTTFIITDTQNDITVNYKGILPTLFREGQGMVAKGSLNADGTFIADELLAKHDENYMPPEVADSLKKAGYWQPEDGEAQ